MHQNFRSLYVSNFILVVCNISSFRFCCKYCSTCWIGNKTINCWCEVFQNFIGSTSPNFTLLGISNWGDLIIKVGDIFTSSYNNKEYIVGNHHVGDVLFLHVNNVEKYERIHLWYDEE